MATADPKAIDLIVIGGGPGGYVAAIRGAQLGMNVTCIEADALGGVCLNWGCIPTKALLQHAHLYEALNDRKTWGFEGELTVDWSKVIGRSRSVAGRLNKGVHSLFKKYGVTHIKGRGQIERPGVVTVTTGDDGTTQTLEAAHIIVATGARPRALPGLPFDGDRIMSSKEALVVDERPGRILIVGAGAIGCEFAYFFRAFGAEVTLVEMSDRIVPVEDHEVSAGLRTSFKRRGISVVTGTIATNIRVEGGTVHADLTPANGEGEPTPIEVDRVLIAVGVMGNVENLGLEACGVEVERGQIVVDTDLRTTCPGIYALGDVAGPPWLAHKASAEGVHCVERIAGHAGNPVRKDNIPGCTYCEPQIASVGMTEQAALAAGLPLRIGRLPMMASGKALAMGHAEGFTKVIFHAETGELLGAHLLGSGVTELISEIALARTMEATEAEILATIHPHPTLSEALHEAVGQAFGEGVNF